MKRRISAELSRARRSRARASVVISDSESQGLAQSARLQLAHALQQLGPVHSGHAHFRNDRVELLALELGEGRGSTSANAMSQITLQASTATISVVRRATAERRRSRSTTAPSSELAVHPSGPRATPLAAPTRRASATARPKSSRRPFVQRTRRSLRHRAADEQRDVHHITNSRLTKTGPPALHLVHTLPLPSLPYPSCFPWPPPRRSPSRIRAAALDRRSSAASRIVPATDDDRPVVDRKAPPVLVYRVSEQSAATRAAFAAAGRGTCRRRARGADTTMPADRCTSGSRSPPGARTPC